MANKGIKKIGIVPRADNARIIYNNGEYISVEPGKPIRFNVSEWFPGTPDADKKKKSSGSARKQAEKES